MVTKKKFDSLTAEQQKTILQIVRERIGKSQNRIRFSEAVITLLDDIAGFKTISVEKSNRLIAKLWRKYNG
jgi:hypothetical protein